MHAFIALNCFRQDHTTVTVRPAPQSAKAASEQKGFSFLTQSWKWAWLLTGNGDLASPKSVCLHRFEERLLLVSAQCIP